MSLWISEVITALIQKVVSVVSQRLMALWLAALMNLCIRSAITTPDPKNQCVGPESDGSLAHHTDRSLAQCSDHCTDPQRGQSGEEKKRLTA